MASRHSLGDAWERRSESTASGGGNNPVGRGTTKKSPPYVMTGEALRRGGESDECPVWSPGLSGSEWRTQRLVGSPSTKEQYYMKHSLSKSMKIRSAAIVGTV